jgi:glycosyltransferase involved in cell wall biosynthesis
MEATYSKIPVSVGILTKNSGKTLRRALSSVKDCAQIIVCDGGSTDETLSIAKEFGCVVIQQNPQFLDSDKKINDYSGVRNQLLDEATNDWFLYIDSDEAISDQLREEIRDITQNNKTDYLVYLVPIRTVLDDHIIQYASNYPGYQNRFFNKKSGARFVKKIHERIEYNRESIKTGTLSGPWYVFGQRKNGHYLRHTKRYRDLEIKAALEQSFFNYLRYTILGNLLVSGKVLIKAGKNYLLHGFKDTEPIHTEVGRVLYPLLVLYGITIGKLKNVIK